MANPHGTPIWYELLSADPDASKTFYEDVIGWTVHASDMPGMDYRMIDVGGNDFVGGLARYGEGETPGGMTPGWRFYIGVDDVDATVEKLTAAGGSVVIPAFDLPDVGRMAYVADPQGINFYVMRGSSPESSTAFARMGMGKCNWNELNTTDQSGAMAFYAAVFGWTYPDKMPMGAMGDYVFIEADGETIGATMNAPPGSPPPAWQFYFRTPDIEATAAKVTGGGGKVHYGPAEVPGGDRIIVACDPQGMMFGAVGPGQPGGA